MKVQEIIEINGKFYPHAREMTDEEIAEMQICDKQIQIECIRYDEAVNQKIRERYTESQEFAILRQRDEKPDEFAEYYSYCEECKIFVKDLLKIQLDKVN
jgi:hypothetical protein